MMYDTGMLARPGGPTLIELDRHASERFKPYGIITADCSGAQEFDDGILVEPLPTATETYRVSVFSVDTSPFYYNDTILRRAMQLTESRYASPDLKSSSYRPMLDKDLTQSLHFAQGTVRRAMVVSFMIGENHAPYDPNISFGRVEVVRNYRYNKFGVKCRYSDAEHSYGRLVDYGRAAALMLRHLNQDYLQEEEARPDHEDIYRSLVHVPNTAQWPRGSNINQAFMVTAGHMIGKVMESENRLGIYRVHNPEDTRYAELIDPTLARFSTQPGPHKGLGLDFYMRGTSPLRRVEDFVTLGLLRIRNKRRQTSERDQKIVEKTVQRLNEREASDDYYHQIPDRYRRSALSEIA